MYLVNYDKKLIVQDSQILSIFIERVSDGGFLVKHPDAHSISIAALGMNNSLALGYYANEREAHEEVRGFLSAIDKGRGSYTFCHSSILSSVKEYLGE